MHQVDNWRRSDSRGPDFTYLGVEFGRRVGWKEMKKVLEKVTKRMCEIEMMRRVYSLSNPHYADLENDW